MTRDIVYATVANYVLFLFVGCKSSALQYHSIITHIQAYQ